MVLKNISPGCGVQASLMLFLPIFYHFSFTSPTCSTVLTSSLPALTSTGARDRPESGLDKSDRDDEPLLGLDIPVFGEEGELFESEEK